MNTKDRINKLTQDIVKHDTEILVMRNIIQLEGALEEKFPSSVTILFSHFDSMLDPDMLPDGYNKIVIFHNLIRFEEVNTKLYANGAEFAVEWDEKRRLWFDPTDIDDDGAHVDYFSR